MDSPGESRDKGDRSITETVIEAVADAEGVGPLELPPLYDSIETDALESLLSGASADDRSEGIEVTFRYYGYAVSVSGDGTVRVVPE